MALLLLLAAPTLAALGAPAVPSAIPYQTLPSGGKLPLLVMGDGVGWGRGTNWSQWLDLVGPGAGVDRCAIACPGLPAGRGGLGNGWGV